MMEGYVVLQRSRDGYSEVVVYDFGNGFKLSVVQKFPKRRCERPVYKGILWRGEKWEKVWEMTTLHKDCVVGQAKQAMALLAGPAKEVAVG